MQALAVNRQVDPRLEGLGVTPLRKVRAQRTGQGPAAAALGLIGSATPGERRRLALASRATWFGHFVGAA